MTTTDEIKELSSQLRNPDGAKGIDLANLMNETNMGMTFHSIERLKIREHDLILELGHGNCRHLAHLLNKENNLIYYGLETSQTMQEEAQKLNKTFIDSKRASFHLYDGKSIPFTDNYFDKIFTVNTIYFWSDPVFLLSELYRITKPLGMLNITFVQKSFMEKLPFTQYGFELYDNDKIAKLLDNTSFEIVGSDTQIETVKTKSGDLVERDFTTISLQKP